MADKFDHPDVEVKKYNTPHLKRMLIMGVSPFLRRAVEKELKRRGELR